MGRCLSSDPFKHARAWNTLSPRSDTDRPEYHRPARILADDDRLLLVSSRPRVIYGLGLAAGARSTAVRRRARAPTLASSRRRGTEAPPNREGRPPANLSPTLRRGDVSRVALRRLRQESPSLFTDTRGYRRRNRRTRLDGRPARLAPVRGAERERERDARTMAQLAH